MTRSFLVACAATLFCSQALAQDYKAPIPAKEEGVRGEIRQASRFEVQLTADQARWASYTVYAPAGCKSIHIEITGSDGDVDLFMRHGQTMDSWYQDADHQAATGLGDEILLVDAHSVPPVQEGKYYLDLVRGGDESIGAFKVTVRFDYVDAAAYSRRGVGRRGEGDLAGALGDMNRAVELAPEDATAWRQRALTRAAMPEQDRAGTAQDYQRAVKLDPSLDADIQATATTSTAFTFKLAEEPRYRSYKLVVPEGCRALRVRASVKDQDLDLYLRYGVPINDWSEDADHEGDSRRLSEELFVDGKEAPPLLAGTYYLDVLRSGAAAPDEEIKLSITFDPKVDLAKDAGYWFTRGYAAANRDDDEVARDAYSRALEIKSDALTHFNRGVVLRRLQDYTASNQDMDAAQRLEPKASYLSTMLYFRGSNHRDLGDMEASVRELRAALVESPEDATTHIGLGQTLMEMGDLTAAGQSMGRGLELNPESGAGHYQLAQLLAIKGQLDEALAAFDQALLYRPAYLEEWDGWVTEDTTLVMTLPPGPTNFHTYVLLVPEGIKAVKVSTVGATANVNLQVRYGLPMRNWITDPDFQASSEASDETLIVPIAKAGRYFLDVDRAGDGQVRAFQVNITFVPK